MANSTRFEEAAALHPRESIADLKWPADPAEIPDWVYTDRRVYDLELERIFLGPTWNYVAVHVYGAFKLIEDSDELHDILKRTVSVYEGGKPQPWSYDPADPVFENMRQKIVGFNIEISRLEGKQKLNQNHPEERRRRVVDVLRSRADSDSQAIAKMMADSLQPNR